MSEPSLDAWCVEIKEQLAQAGIVLGKGWKAELSHHHGLEKFPEVGCGLITCIDENFYCKKLIVMLPGQRHPEHVHMEKVETFEVLWGDFILWRPGFAGERRMVPGSYHETIHPGYWHGFRSEEGCVVEEISTAYEEGGSIYRPGEITAGGVRKTPFDLV